VTRGTTQMDAGWVTTACLKDIRVHLPVTLHPLLNAQLQKLSVIGAGMEIVGKEISACLKDLSVQYRVTTQLRQFVPQLLLYLLLHPLQQLYDVIVAMMPMGVGWETIACLQGIPVLHLVIHLNLLYVKLHRRCVTWEWMEIAGKETSVCLSQLSAHQHVLIQLQQFVLLMRKDVTMDMIKMGAGKETTACLRDTHAPHHVMNLYPLHVMLQLKWFVTEVWMEAAGRETSVCQWEVFVLQHVTTQLLLFVLQLLMILRQDVIMVMILMDAGRVTTACH